MFSRILSRRVAVRRTVVVPVAALLIALVALGTLLSMTNTAKAVGNTGTVAVCLNDSTGTNLVLDSDKAWFQVDGGSINYVGAVGSSGCREQTVTGTNVAVWVKYNATYSEHNMVPVPNGGTTRVDFYTTKVTLQYSNGIAFGGSLGNSRFFNKPSMELLNDGGGGVHFRLDQTGGASGRMTLNWPSATGLGATYEATLAAARVIDSDGNPLAGVDVDGYSGGWFDAGTTGATGVLAFSHPGLGAITSVAAIYGGTRQQINQNSLTNSVYLFQTEAVVVQLRDADMQPLDTGNVSYYASGWYAAGPTSGGEVSIEMLPGSYSFVMVYNHSRQQINGIDISSTNPVVFQTGNVDIHYSESAQWYYTPTGYHSFATPQELLPGNISVYLYGSPLGRCEVPITVASGDHLSLSGVVATLRDSAGQGAAGGVATAYASGWKSIGTTDSGGRACALFDGTLGNTSVRMVYNGSSQKITQHQPTNSIYAFQTGDVTLELRNSGNGLIDTGMASYYASGWHTIGNTSGGQVHVDLLPGSYSFAMKYNGTRQQINHVAVADGSVVTFQTTGVTVELRNSSGVLFDTGSASYYASGWHSIGDTSGGTATVEMLPGSYSFAMKYNGTRQQKNGVNITSTNPVVFQTVAVELQLQDHSGSALDTGSPSYYASGWHSIADTVGGSSTVEMLPGSYSFAMKYNGTRQQMNGVNITSTNPVVFQTGQVTSTSGNATAYYASGWQPFRNSGELLPGKYWFAFSDQGNSFETVTGGVSTPIH